MQIGQKAGISSTNPKPDSGPQWSTDLQRTYDARSGTSQPGTYLGDHDTVTAALRPQWSTDLHR